MDIKIALQPSAEEYRAGLQLLAQDHPFTLADDGLPLDAESGSDPALRYDGQRAVITCGQKAQFFRMFVQLLQRLPDGPCEVTEHACFDKCGPMFDCSRNAVLTVEGFGRLARRMAAMGLNMAMLYTEDTYEIPGRPYFGYLRGRYSASELRAMDDCADALGIELIPCIQTLGHLEKYLRWPAANELADLPNVLLCGDEKVLAFLKDSIAAASAPFRSRRIHLGMDEAMGLGSGRYLFRHGYRPAIDILREHLRQVAAICDEQGLQPMIWSDMCLRPLSPVDEYCDFEHEIGPVTKELADAVPANMQLVYWDYYHAQKQQYATMIARHRLYGNPLIFAGGSWNWSGPVPSYGKTFLTSAPGLAAAREAGVREVLCTVWGDDGAESSLTNSLLGLQYFAENMYTEAPDLPAVFAAFARCCGGVAEDFYDLRLLDELPGVPKDNPDVLTPTKQILYQDVLFGLFDKHFRVQRETFGSMREWYRQRANALAAAEARNPLYAKNFRLYRLLAEICSEKAEVGIDIHAAYAAKDREAMRAQVTVLHALVEKYDALLPVWEAVWLDTNKPFGFDVLSVRVGGVRGRIVYAIRRLDDWVDGRVAALPELEEEQLFFDGRREALHNGSPLPACWGWARMATACPL